MTKANKSKQMTTRGNRRAEKKDGLALAVKVDGLTDTNESMKLMIEFPRVVWSKC